MKTFKQHINEALDKPYKWTSSGKNLPYIMDYMFYTGDGKKAQAGVYEAIRGELEFAFDVAGAVTVTGAGDAFRIYATIADIVQSIFDEYMKTRPEDFKSFSFEADKFDRDAAATRNERFAKQSLYRRFAKKLAAKYGLKVIERNKSYGDATRFSIVKQGINEEWVDHTNRNGDIFKNPSPREWRDYVSGLNDSFIAGFEYKGDVYYLSGGLHDEAIRHLNIPHDDSKVLKFRAKIYNGKMEAINTSGGSIPGITQAEFRRKYFERFAKLFKNKNFNPYLYMKDDAHAMFYNGVFETLRFWEPDFIQQFIDAFKKHGINHIEGF